MTAAPNLLAINPGSSSTKFGLYRDEEQVVARKLDHGKAELAGCGAEVLSQLALRLQRMEDELDACGIRLDAISAVVGRGGLLRPVQGGTYRVNDAMLEELRRAERGEHAANLGAFLAHAIASRIGVPAYIVDPVSVDEWIKVARLSGCARVASYLRSDRRDEQLIALLASRLSEGYVFDTQPAWLRSQLVADESKPQIRKSAPQRRATHDRQCLRRIIIHPSPFDLDVVDTVPHGACNVDADNWLGREQRLASS